MSVAIVQGASRGLGLALTRVLLAETQLNVIATCRQPDSATKHIMEGIRDNNSKDRLTILPLDVTDEETVRMAAEKVKEKHGEKCVRLFLNVAGILHAEKAIQQLDMDRVLESFKVNAFGPMVSAKHFVPLLSQNHQQSNESFLSDFSAFASISARVGSIGDNRLGGWYSYRCSKASLNQFTKTLSREFYNRKRNSIAVSLHPGTVDTALSAPFQSNIAKDKIATADEAANHLFQVLKHLNKNQNGNFIAWDGKDIEY